MKRAVITNAYSAKNAGDAAIMLATAEMLRTLGFTDIRLASRYAEEDREFYSAYDLRTVSPAIAFPVRGGMSGLARATRLLASLALVSLLCLAHGLSRRHALRLARTLRQDGFLEVATADVVAIAGGGYLYSSRRRIDLTLLHHLLTMKLNTVVNRTVVMMPQSIGPLTGRKDTLLTRWALSGVDPVVGRDGPSMAVATSVLPRRRAVECPDVAFFGWARIANAVEHGVGSRTTVSATPVRQVRERPTVCIVLMDWSWARPGSEGALARFQDEMAAVIRGCRERGYRVICAGHSHLPSHGQDDAGFARGIIERMGLEIDGDQLTMATADTPDDLRAIYASADLVVGTRMHACILSMLEGVPALGLAYQPKTTGLYAQLGLPDWCTDVEAVKAENLLSHIHDLVEFRDAARERVRKAVGSARSAIVTTYSSLADV